MKLIVIHLPKTGGTALRNAIWSAYNVQTYYKNEYLEIDEPEILYGHLRVSEAKSKYPGVPVATFVRHPYGQIRSNYDHYCAFPDTKFQPYIGVLPRDMSFEQFIEYEPMRNNQSKFLDGEVDFLGRSELLQFDVIRLNKRYGLDIPNVTFYNVTEYKTAVTARHLELIEKYHADDLDLYRAVSMQ